MGMDIPKPGPAHQKLALLAGKWTGEEVMHPGPMGPGGKFVGTSVSKMSPDGFYLYVDYHQKAGKKKTFFGHSVIGYDLMGKQYLWYWVDSMGMPPCTATPGKFARDAFVFEHDTPHGRMRYSYKMKGADRYLFRIESSGDAGKTWTPFMDGDYHRAK